MVCVCVCVGEGGGWGRSDVERRGGRASEEELQSRQGSFLPSDGLGYGAWGNHVEEILPLTVR